MKDIPAFADFWQLTNKTGKKEMFASRWRYVSDSRKIELFNKVKNLKVKPTPEEIL